MMSSQDYIWAWLVYGVGVFGALWCLWRMSSPLKVDSRRLLVILLAAVLLTPALADPAQVYLAPAFMVALFDLLQNGFDSIPRGGLAIILSAVCAVIISFFYELWARSKQASKRFTIKSSEDAEGSVSGLEGK